MKSEPTLYRLIDIDSDDPEYGLGNSGTMYRGHVEPVERCEHGKIDGHRGLAGIGDWCPGAGIGGDERRCPENVWNGDMGPCICGGKVHPGIGGDDETG